MKLQVKITKEDILDGLKEDARSCPIALALRRIFPEREINVFGNVAWVYSSQDCFGPKMIAQLGWEGMSFVLAFDEGREVEPFDLALNFTSDYETPF